MNSNKYWLFQLGGWSTALFLITLVKYVVGNLNFDESVGIIIMFASCVAASHTLRFFLKPIREKYGIVKLILSTLLLLFLISPISVILMFALSTMLQPWIYEGMNLWSPLLIVANTFNVFALLVVWATCYLLITKQRSYVQLAHKQLMLNESLKDAQLSNLINQINPHFIFNALNNIRALVLVDQHRARDMITHLADMLRYSLAKDDEKLVPFSKEFTVVEDYIGLASIQFEERLEYKKTIDPSCDSCLIPKMLLQLLVENAIKHGISHLKGVGILQINVTRHGDMVHLTVTNTGKLKKAQSDSGVGLKNIRDRLSLHFGDKAQFSLEQQQHSVCANVIIPFTEHHHD